MAKILEHNVGDLTAVLQAGVPLAEAQAAFAAEGQMLALDPPLGEGDAATVGGMVATADSGPLRHRYGGVRDLIVGISLALSDGTLAKAGSKVIKNVAGYDLAKLFTGSQGTLGLIVTVTVRLHPKADGTATAVGASDDPEQLAKAATALAAPAARGRLARRRLAPGRGAAAGPLPRRDRGRPGRGGRRAHARRRARRRADRRGRRGAVGGRARRAAPPRWSLAEGVGAHDRPRPRHPRRGSGRRIARLARRARAVVDHARLR